MGVLRIGVLTSSDTRAAGGAEDTSGAALKALAVGHGWEVASYRLLPDDRDAIASALIEMTDVDRCDISFHHPGERALARATCCPRRRFRCRTVRFPASERSFAGESLKITDRAMLSRATAGQRGSTLIINMPGSEKAVRESFGFVDSILEHAVEMMAGGGHG